MSANDELAGRMARMDAALPRSRATVRFLDAPADGFVVEVEDAPPRSAGILWVPIAEMPEAWKDGREVLFWYPKGITVQPSEANDWEYSWLPTAVGMRCDQRGFWTGYYDGIGPCGEPTHAAAINPPEGV